MAPIPAAEFVGHDDVNGRDLFILAIATPEELPERVVLSSPRFVCLLAWDARGVDADRVGKVARKLLDSGAVYICAWGPDCERVHDIIDEEEVGENPADFVDRVVMTTWHPDEPLSEATEFVFLTWPDEAYAAGCDSTLGVAIGSAAWAEEMRLAFAAR